MESRFRHANDPAFARKALVRSCAVEFDPQKSETNRAKHGIDFITAQALWNSKHVLLGAKDAFEKRYMVIGVIGSQHWSAIITYRGATICITSVRKSRPLEIETYEKIAG